LQQLDTGVGSSKERKKEENTKDDCTNGRIFTHHTRKKEWEVEKEGLVGDPSVGEEEKGGAVVGVEGNKPEKKQNNPHKKAFGDNVELEDMLEVVSGVKEIERSSF
jgi:hypothetical protein